jgi:hypothetical protein
VSVVSGLAVVALTAFGLVGSGVLPVKDSVGGEAAAAATQRVSQTLLTDYCPSRVGLSDQEAYGDSQFSVSQGNLSSASRFAAVGSVYGSTVNSVAGTKLADLVSGDDSLALGGQKAEESTIFNSTLLSADAGTGAVGTVASWASKGDVQGIAATACSSAQLTSHFVVPQTTTGTTNTLVVANTSDKPTSVDVALRGTTTNKALAASTSTAITVGAHGEKTFDLSAAAPNQKGLFVTVSSKVVPVFSTVKVTAAEGLTSKGVDYVPQAQAQRLGSSEASSATASAVLAGVSEHQNVTLRLYSAADQTLSVTWLGSKGERNATNASVEAGKVTALDLGSVPSNATALAVTSKEASAGVVYVSATATTSGNGQQDFSVLSSQQAVQHSGLTVPDGVSASLVLANPSDTDQKVTLEGMDGNGAVAKTVVKTIAAHSALRVTMSSLGNARTAVMTADSDGTSGSHAVTLGAQMSADAMGSTAQASVVEATSLMPQTAEVSATRSLMVSVE